MMVKECSARCKTTEDIQTVSGNCRLVQRPLLQTQRKATKYQFEEDHLFRFHLTTEPKPAPPASSDRSSPSSNPWDAFESSKASVMPLRIHRIRFIATLKSYAVHRERSFGNTALRRMSSIFSSSRWFSRRLMAWQMTPNFSACCPWLKLHRQRR